MLNFKLIPECVEICLRMSQLAAKAIQFDSQLNDFSILSFGFVDLLNGKTCLFSEIFILCQETFFLRIQFLDFLLIIGDGMIILFNFILDNWNLFFKVVDLFLGFFDPIQELILVLDQICKFGLTTPMPLQIDNNMIQNRLQLDDKFDKFIFKRRVGKHMKKILNLRNDTFIILIFLE